MEVVLLPRNLIKDQTGKYLV